MLFWVTHIILFIILLTLLEGYSIVLLTYQIFYEQNIQDFLKHTAKDYHNQSVNPPIVRASTIIFKSMQDIRKMQDKAKNVLTGGHFDYGRQGTSTTHILSQILKNIEEAYHVFLTPTGFGAVFLSIFSEVDLVMK